jgi:3-isopropylmalate/(R)-2-methylmalate dehydratase small subunit
MKVTGKIFMFGDHVNTDEIIPARYLSSHDPGELAQYCMEDARPGFGRRNDIKGAIIAAGENFGCGSSREHAPIAIKASGIRCVIAASFARIFLRNSINIGLPLLTLPDAPRLREESEIEVDFEAGTVFDPASSRTWSFQPYPPFMRDIIRQGGWLNYAKNVLK